jgi:hypothetical protein
MHDRPGAHSSPAGPTWKCCYSAVGEEQLLSSTRGLLVAGPCRVVIEGAWRARKREEVVREVCVSVCACVSLSPRGRRQ